MNKHIRRFISVFSIIGFIACTVLLLYPVISDRWNRYRDMQLIGDYNEKVLQIEKTDYDSIMQKAADYNKYLITQNRNIVTDAEYDPDAYYETLLNFTGNGIIGTAANGTRFDFSRHFEGKLLANHDAYGMMLKVAQEIKQAVSIPVGTVTCMTGGRTTHTVLTGHRGLPNQKFFSDLDKLKPGDKFYMHILNQTLAYKVYKIKVIEPTDVDELMIENGRDLATLVTCTPYGVNTHRLLVMGRRTPFDESQTDEKGLVTAEEHKLVIDPAVWVFAGFMLFIVLLVISTAVRKIISKFHSKKGGSA